MHRLAEIETALRANTKIDGAGYTEEIMYIDGPKGPMFAALLLPVGRAPSAALIVCPSLFELATLQPTELLFLRRAATEGFAGIYVQPPGVGESAGDPGETRMSDRIEAADAGLRELSLRFPKTPRCYFGARLGAAVALRAAGTGEATGLVAWDPVFEAEGYLRQIRRLARISAIAGGSSAFRDPLHRLRETGRVSILGNVVTALQIEDLSAVEVSDPVVEGPVLVVAMGERSRTAATERLTHAGDLEVIELEGRDLAGLGMSVREAPHAITPTIEWMKRKF